MGASLNMVVIFHDELDEDAHDLFQTWRRNNEGGFFINCKGKSSWMVHRVTCPHPGDTEWGRDFGASLTKFKKVCSGDIQELVQWARRAGSVNLTFCSHCSPPEATDEIEQSLTGHAQRLADAGFFDPQGITDARERILASIVRRQGQPAFRRHLLLVYKGQCAITGCNVEAVLDAAHIVPYNGPETNHPGNGLLLRTDLHTLFDLGLVAIDTESMTVLVSPVLAGTCYEDYRERRIRIPEDGASCPSREALDQHREASGLL